MVIDLANDGKNIIFNIKQKWIQPTADYKLTLYSPYNNRWLFHAYSDYPPETGSQTQSGTFYRYFPTQPNAYAALKSPYGIKLTLANSGSTYVSFSWDKDDIDGLGTSLSQIVDIDRDINGYYIAQLNSCQSAFNASSQNQGSTSVIKDVLCKVVANWGDTTGLDTVYKPNTIYPSSQTGVYIDKENQEEYTYYRDE